MKTTILFTFLAFSFLQKQIPPRVKVLSHSNYKNHNGIACVLYNEKIYTMKWFGVENSISNEKIWLIDQQDKCFFGGPTSDFQEDFKDSRKAKKEILVQLLKPKKIPLKHPE